MKSLDSSTDAEMNQFSSVCIGVHQWFLTGAGNFSSKNAAPLQPNASNLNGAVSRFQDHLENRNLSHRKQDKKLVKLARQPAPKRGPRGGSFGGRNRRFAAEISVCHMLRVNGYRVAGFWASSNRRGDREKK